MTEILTRDRSVSLKDLLRRMAAMNPAELQGLVWDCANNSPPEVQACLKEYGPLGGLVRLAPMFPRGYLDTAVGMTTASLPDDYRFVLGGLLQALNRGIPERPREQLVQVCDARLDDIVFRDIARRCEKTNDHDSDELRERLFTIYDIPPQLSRLADVVSRLKAEIDLSDAVVVAHQHILGTVVTQFEALWELGLLPSRTYVVGKPYSTNRLAMMYLEHRGCEVRSGLQFGKATDAIRSPDWYQTRNHNFLGHLFAKIVKALPEQKVSRLVVLDDGGLILTWLNRAFETELFSPGEQMELERLQVIGVEQTTFGRHLIERLGSPVTARPAIQIPIPVANVAETRLKLEKESGLIASSVVRELDSWLRSSSARGTHARTLREASVGVIGFGVVGSWVCQALRQEAVRRIVVFDDDVSHSSIARSFGYQVVRSVEELARECTVIIGCSGAPEGVGLESSQLRPGTVLASASSGNHEFAPVFITGVRDRRYDINPEVTPDRDATAFDWVHSIFAIKVPDGSAFVLNGGFPVNFTGAVDPIRAEDIELTRSLIVLGVAAAYRHLGANPNFGGPVRLATIDEEPLTEMFGP